MKRSPGPQRTSHAADDSRTSTGRRGPRQRSRRQLLGAVLILVGLGSLGYAGWEYAGTNIVSHHHQRLLVEQTQRVWRTTPTPGSTATTDIETAQALIRIPRFGSSYVVPVLQGVSERVLAKGFGHFPGTTGPGQRGNYALAAHRVTHGQPLRNMPELRPGDTVIVETRATRYTYVLDTDPNHLVIPLTSSWVLQTNPHNPDDQGVQPSGNSRLLTLTTCSELFHTTNRMIVFGHLVTRSPQPRTNTAVWSTFWQRW